MEYPKAYADVFEAVLSTIHMDCGKDTRIARKVVLQTMEEKIGKKFD